MPRIQTRHDTAANWTLVNPILQPGEFGYDITNEKIKIGNAQLDRWNDLPYYGGGPIDIVYTNPSYPSIGNIEDALNTLLYVSPLITSFTNNVGNVEKGTTVNSVNLTWTLNKTLIAGYQKIDTNDLGDLALRSKSYTGLNITANKTYTLDISDGTNTKSATTTINFLSKRFWGADASISVAASEAGARSLAGNELSTSRVQSKTFDCTGGKYIYFAFPDSFGTPTFKCGGLESTFTKTAFSFTGYGNEAFSIYRSGLQTGSGIVIDVT